MKIYALLLALLPLSLFGQARLAIKTDSVNILDFNGVSWDFVPDTLTYMSLQESARLEYWGLKGINSQLTILSLERELSVADQQLAFKDFQINNCKSYQAEYAQRLEDLSTLYSKKEEDFKRVEAESLDWEKKAKNRGKMLAAGAGVIGALLIGIALGG